MAGILLLTMCPAGIVAAQNADMPPLVIGNDRGGSLRERLIELGRLRAADRPVEIRGRICYCTCTMYLGLPQTCISRDTVFGFHGPSRGGRRLQSQEFDRYSRIISGHYPAALGDWYMTEGRNRLWRVHRIKGEQIIDMGVRAC